MTLIAIVIIILTSLYAWNNQDIYRKWIFNPYRVKNNKEYYRFLTSGLIHQDYVHLGFNMLTLYFFGDVIEHYLSPVNFLVLLVVGIIVSEIPTYLKHKDHSYYNSLGASGGVSSVIFSSIFLNPLNDICFYFVLCLPGFILGILYLIYSYFKGKKADDHINHDAHFYGAAFGIVYTIIIRPESFMDFFYQISQWELFR
jgi:membrane associated rhomboid family serine protease